MISISVFTNCTDGFFSVCYDPHDRAPYSRLRDDLLSGTALSQLVPSEVYYPNNFANLPVENVVHPCQLNAYSIANVVQLDLIQQRFKQMLSTGTTRNDDILFCAHFDAWTKSNTCGVRTYQLSVRTNVFGTMLTYEDGWCLLNFQYTI